MGCSQEPIQRGWVRLKRVGGFGQFVDLREGRRMLARKSGVVVLKGRFMHTMLYDNVYFLNIFYLFFRNRNLFKSFPFLFCDEIFNIRNIILTIQKPE